MAKKDDTDRRVYPRYKFTKNIEVMIGSKRIPGFTYDISQGGVAFIAEALPALSDVNIRLIDSGFVFTGKLVGQQDAGKPGLFRYRIEFAASLSLQDVSAFVDM